MASSPPESPSERRPRMPLGRGSSPDKPGEGTPQRFFGPRTIVILLVLLALNYAIASAFNRPEPSVRIPYQPTFLQQVREGNVARVSTEGTTVDGEFRKA